MQSQREGVRANGTQRLSVMLEPFGNLRRESVYQSERDFELGTHAKIGEIEIESQTQIYEWFETFHREVSFRVYACAGGQIHPRI